MKNDGAQIRVAPASGGCEIFNSMFSVGCSMFDVWKSKNRISNEHRTSNIEHPPSNNLSRTRRRQVLPAR
jgi:hypothetical protein